MTLDESRALDSADPLRTARERFQLPDGTIYLDGNSLGALPRAAPDAVSRVMARQWGDDLIASWTKHDWIDWPIKIAAKLAPLLGCRPAVVLIADSTSVCLFKLLSAAIGARPGRSTILTSDGNFPTDLYVAQGLAALAGASGSSVPAAEVAQAIGGDTAVVMLTHVDYRSSEKFDIAAINRAAHDTGALTLWDLSHSAGALELNLDADQCDLAVGCGYKYLNGGPGAPAYIFVAEHLQAELRPALQGWMGHGEPFAFDSAYAPVAGIGRFLTGTPSILALAALEAGLDTFEGVALAALQAKSRALSALFVDQVEAGCGDQVRLASPRDPSARGSHVSFAHGHGYAVMQALIARGVIGDFRAPDLLRFGFAPLYTSFEDAWRAAAAVVDVLATREWDDPRFRKRSRVT